MKKLLLALLVIGATIGIGNVATASAANCHVSLTAIYYDGTWASDVYFTNCDHVNGTRVLGREYGTDTGINWPAAHRDYPTNTPTVTMAGSTPTTNWLPFTFRVPVFGPGCGAPAITVQSHFYYQLRNSNGSTWGQLYQATSANQVIC